MVSKAVQVQTMKAHFTEQVEGNLGFSGNGVADDEGVVEAGAVVEVVVAAAAEGVEEVKDEGHEAGAGEDAEDGGEGAAGVVEVGLAAGPVEEAEAGEDVAGGGAVAEDAEDEGLGERGEGEGGEGGVEGGVVLGLGGQGLEDAGEEWVPGGVAGVEPCLERVCDVVLGYSD